MLHEIEKNIVNKTANPAVFKTTSSFERPGEKGKEKVFVGEVRAMNHDTSDNRFYTPIGRFPGIIEDEEPLHLLASGYKKFI